MEKNTDRLQKKLQKGDKKQKEIAKAIKNKNLTKTFSK